MIRTTLMLNHSILTYMYVDLVISSHKYSGIHGKIELNLIRLLFTKYYRKQFGRHLEKRSDDRPKSSVYKIFLFCSKTLTTPGFIYYSKCSPFLKKDTFWMLSCTISKLPNLRSMLVYYKPALQVIGVLRER